MDEFQAVTFLSKKVQSSGFIFLQALFDHVETAPENIKSAIGHSVHGMKSFLEAQPCIFVVFNTGHVILNAEYTEARAFNKIVALLRQKKQLEVDKLRMSVAGYPEKERNAILLAHGTLLPEFLQKHPFLFYFTADNMVGLWVDKFLEITHKYFKSKWTKCILTVHVIEAFISLGLDIALTIGNLYQYLLEKPDHASEKLPSNILSALSQILDETNIFKKRGTKYIFEPSRMNPDCYVHLMVSAILEGKEGYLSQREVKKVISFCEPPNIIDTAISKNYFYELSTSGGAVGIKENTTWKAATYLLKLCDKHDTIGLQRITGYLSTQPDDVRETLGRNCDGIKDFVQSNPDLFYLDKSGEVSSVFRLTEKAALDMVNFFKMKVKERQTSKKTPISLRSAPSYMTGAPDDVKRLGVILGPSGIETVLKSCFEVFTLTNVDNDIILGLRNNYQEEDQVKVERCSFIPGQAVAAFLKKGLDGIENGTETVLGHAGDVTVNNSNQADNNNTDGIERTNSLSPNLQNGNKESDLCTKLQTDASKEQEMVIFFMKKIKERQGENKPPITLETVRSYMNGAPEYVRLLGVSLGSEGIQKLLKSHGNIFSFNPVGSKIAMGLKENYQEYFQSGDEKGKNESEPGDTAKVKESLKRDESDRESRVSSSASSLFRDREIDNQSESTDCESAGDSKDGKEIEQDKDDGKGRARKKSKRNKKKGQVSGEEEANGPMPISNKEILYSDKSNIVDAAALENYFHELSTSGSALGMKDSKTREAAKYLLKLCDKHGTIDLQRITGYLSTQTDDVRETLGRNRDGIRNFVLSNSDLFGLDQSGCVFSVFKQTEKAIQNMVNFFVTKVKGRQISKKPPISLKSAPTFLTSAPEGVRKFCDSVGPRGIGHIFKSFSDIFTLHDIGDDIILGLQEGNKSHVLIQAKQQSSSNDAEYAAAQNVKQSENTNVKPSQKINVNAIEKSNISCPNSVVSNKVGDASLKLHASSTSQQGMVNFFISKVKERQVLNKPPITLEHAPSYMTGAPKDVRALGISMGAQGIQNLLKSQRNIFALNPVGKDIVLSLRDNYHEYFPKEGAAPNRPLILGNNEPGETARESLGENQSEKDRCVPPSPASSIKSEKIDICNQPVNETKLLEEIVNFFIRKIQIRRVSNKPPISLENAPSFMTGAPEETKSLGKSLGPEGIQKLLKSKTNVFTFIKIGNDFILGLHERFDQHESTDDGSTEEEDAEEKTEEEELNGGAKKKRKRRRKKKRKSMDKMEGNDENASRILEDCKKSDSGLLINVDCEGKLLCVFKSWGLLECKEVCSSGSIFFFTINVCRFPTHSADLRELLQKGQTLYFDCWIRDQDNLPRSCIVTNVRFKTVLPNSELIVKWVFSGELRRNGYMELTDDEIQEQALVGKVLTQQHVSILNEVVHLLIKGTSNNIGSIFESLQIALQVPHTPLKDTLDLLTFLEMYESLFHIHSSEVRLKNNLCDGVITRMMGKAVGFISPKDVDTEGNTDLSKTVYFTISELKSLGNFSGNPIPELSLNLSVCYLSVPTSAFPNFDGSALKTYSRAAIVFPIESNKLDRYQKENRNEDIISCKDVHEFHFLVSFVIFLIKVKRFSLKNRNNPRFSSAFLEKIDTLKLKEYAQNHRKIFQYVEEDESITLVNPGPPDSTSWAFNDVFQNANGDALKGLNENIKTSSTLIVTAHSFKSRLNLETQEILKNEAKSHVHMMTSLCVQENGEKENGDKENGEKENGEKENGEKLSSIINQKKCWKALLTWDQSLDKELLKHSLDSGYILGEVSEMHTESPEKEKEYRLLAKESNEGLVKSSRQPLQKPITSDCPKSGSSMASLNDRPEECLRNYEIREQPTSQGDSQEVREYVPQFRNPVQLDPSSPVFVPSKTHIPFSNDTDVGGNPRSLQNKQENKPMCSTDNSSVGQHPLLGMVRYASSFIKPLALSPFQFFTQNPRQSPPSPRVNFAPNFAAHNIQHHMLPRPVPLSMAHSPKLINQCSNEEHLDILMKISLLILQSEELSMSVLLQHLHFHTEKWQKLFATEEELVLFLNRYNIFITNRSSIRLKSDPLQGTVTKIGGSTTIGSYGFIREPVSRKDAYFTENCIHIPKDPEKKCFVDYMLRYQSQVYFIAIPASALPQSLRGNQISELRAVLVWNKEGSFQRYLGRPNKLSVSIPLKMEGTETHVKNKSNNERQVVPSFENKTRDDVIIESCSSDNGFKEVSIQTISTGDVLMTKYFKS